jgi:hypothetical protein
VSAVGANLERAVEEPGVGNVVLCGKDDAKTRNSHDVRQRPCSRTTRRVWLSGIMGSEEAMEKGTGGIYLNG